MKKPIALLTACCLQAMFCAQAVRAAQAAEVRVELSQTGKRVSPNLFGIFLEEINHAGDGGLYAELIRNGSFTEATTLDAWSMVRTGSAKVNLFFDESVPLNPVKSRSLRIEINSPGGERAGVANEGYWGISAKKGESYAFSMYVRSASGFDGPVTVSLESKDGAVYGQTQITGLKADWGRFSGSIPASATDPSARLTISANRSGTFWINMVSLRPGNDIFRADLLQKLKDLKPGLVRFPGGTYVLGNVRLVNTSPLKQNVNIDLAGAGAKEYSAVATELSSKDLDHENSLAEPTRIAPIEHQLPSVGSKFRYELGGNSFTVLKLTPERK